jgi:hypothetical protein
MESALKMIRQNTINGYKLVTYFVFAAALVLGCFGAFEIFTAGSWFLALFMLGMAVVFVAIGVASLTLVRSKT